MPNMGLTPELQKYLLWQSLMGAGQGMLAASAPSTDPRSRSMAYALSQGMGGFQQGQQQGMAGIMSAMQMQEMQRRQQMQAEQQKMKEQVAGSLFTEPQGIASTLGGGTLTESGQIIPQGYKMLGDKPVPQGIAELMRGAVLTSDNPLELAMKYLMPDKSGLIAVAKDTSLYDPLQGKEVYRASGDIKDKIGNYDPSDYTTESWSKFLQSNNPNDLVRYSKENIKEYTSTSIMINPKDNKPHVYKFNPDTNRYDMDQGIAPETMIPFGYDPERQVMVGVGSKTKSLQEVSTVPLASKNTQELPTAIQEDLNGAFDALRNLKVMDSSLSETGRFQGLISKGQVFFGANQKAIDFETARNNMKLAAQAIIKGIPSNFDVSTVIDTLPAMTLPENVNKSRVQESNKKLSNLIKNVIAYYKGTNTVIPKPIIEQARQYGINIDVISPWSGKGDPLTGSSTDKLLNNIKTWSDEDLLRELNK